MLQSLFLSKDSKSTYAFTPQVLILKKDNLLRLVLIFLTSTALLSCKKNNNAELTPIYTAAEIAKMRSVLQNQYGFTDTTILETPTSFVCENDIVFNKQNFLENYCKQVNTQSKHYRTNVIVTQPQTIKVAIATTVPTRWQTGVYDAVAKWNSLGLKIRFSAYVSNACPIGGVTVEWKSLGTSLSTLAQANTPTSSSQPGAVLTINSTSLAITDANWRRNTIVHELGHTIGMHHTDGNLGVALNIYNCNGKDPNSVFQSVVPNNSFTYTNCDITAINYLFK